METIQVKECVWMPVCRAGETDGFLVECRWSDVDGVDRLNCISVAPDGGTGTARGAAMKALLAYGGDPETLGQGDYIEHVVAGGEWFFEVRAAA